MTTIVALPGDHTPWQDAARRLQVDIGDPAWVDYYWRTLSGIGTLERVIVYCYSAGAVELAESSDDPRIVGAIIYEGEPPVEVFGDFPILLISNVDGLQNGPRRARYLDGVQLWAAKHPIESLTGNGRHVKRVWDWRRSWRPWRLGHGHDVALNGAIGDWIKRHQ